MIENELTAKANELEIAILNLFIEIRVRYPNMVIGRLARDNVKKAMDNGITASQVSSSQKTLGGF